MGTCLSSCTDCFNPSKKSQKEPLLQGSDFDDSPSNNNSNYNPPSSSSSSSSSSRNKNRTAEKQKAVKSSMKNSRQDTDRKVRGSGDVSLQNTREQKQEDQEKEPDSMDDSDVESVRTVSGDSVLDLDIMEFQGLVHKGFLRKRGHMMRNWKRRYFVLEHGVINYYEKGLDFPPYGEGLKGQLPLLGATVELKDEPPPNPPLIHIIGKSGEKDLLMQADREDELRVWYKKINDVIRSCNIRSIENGEELPEIADWYQMQCEYYEEALVFMGQGHLFQKHGYDRLGRPVVQECWVQVSKEENGLIWQHVTDGTGSSRSQRGHPHTLLFKDITDIIMGSEENGTRRSGRMGNNSVMFSIVTRSHALDLEVENDSIRQRWIKALQDVLGFLAIPSMSVTSDRNVPKGWSSKDMMKAQKKVSSHRQEVRDAVRHAQGVSKSDEK